MALVTRKRKNIGIETQCSPNDSLRNDDIEDATYQNIAVLDKQPTEHMRLLRWISPRPSIRCGMNL